MVPLHYSSGASFQRLTCSKWNMCGCTITLQFWGILPTRRRPGVSSGRRYHYITVLGHPYQQKLSKMESDGHCTITLQFWGILPTTSRVVNGLPGEYHYITVLGHPSNGSAWANSSITRYHYITVLGHPSNDFMESIEEVTEVPLHYSSGASFQPTPPTKST